MSIFIDLHMHSQYSVDGEILPAELVRKCKDAGIRIMAVADHNHTDGVEEALEKEDLLIEAAQMEGYISDTDHGITVVLDTNLTPELLEEGFVREIISKVQTMRKDAGFEVMDHIRVSMQDNDKVKETIQRNEAEIKSEVMADEVAYEAATGFTKEWSINGEKVVLGVEKL